MKCPDVNCIGKKTGVCYTRTMDDRIMRKRKCFTCGKYFWTEEKFFAYTTATSKKFIQEMTQKKEDEDPLLDIEGIREIIEGVTYKPKFWETDTGVSSDGVTILEPDPTFDNNKVVKVKINRGDT